eukprot:scaffold4163_cov168-Ochromonas_danica.AAC.1
MTPWYVALESKPRLQVVGVFIAGCLGIATVCSFATKSVAVQSRTLSPEWKRAQKEYMKFQSMNTLFGVSAEKVVDDGWSVMVYVALIVARAVP